MPFEKELASAQEAARRASTVILGLYETFTRIEDAPASISTQADRDSQDAILDFLSNEYPDDAFRAEENTVRLSQLRRHGSRMWVIDPIDGTRGFAMKNGEFSIMIALVVDGKAVVGVVAEPAHGRSTFAARGLGCFRDDGGTIARTTVSSTRLLADSTATQSHSKPGRGPNELIRRLNPKHVIETYSAGIKLAQVARAEADLYPCDYDALNDWDLAAGHILVEEAGGKVTDLIGQPVVYGQEPMTRPVGGILASNGWLQLQSLSRIRAS